MSHYFRLATEVDDDVLTIDIASHEDLSFTAGVPFADPIDEPIRFRADMELGGSVLPTTFLPEPVFKSDFLQHLRELGVSNIDDYAAEISTPGGKQTIEGYRAVNIVGAVACADLSHSEYEDFEGMFFFDRLVINPMKARSALCFRLAEAHEYILIHQRVAEGLDRKRFPDIVLTPIEASPGPAGQ